MPRRRQKRHRNPVGRSSDRHSSRSVPSPIANEPLLAEAFALSGTARTNRLREVAETLRERMEADASELKDLVLTVRPQDLLGYLWSALHMQAMYDFERVGPREPEDEAETSKILAALEYAHAVWSCFPRDTDREGALDERAMAMALDLVERIRQTAMSHSLAASSRSEQGPFGPATGFIEFNARSTWILIRGNRYQVLEGEFFAFVLKPHDGAFRRAYGIGSDVIAEGIQSIATSLREGFSEAAHRLEGHMNATHDFAAGRGISVQQAITELASVDADRIEDLSGSMKDLLWGGICNVSRHSQLPSTLLADLAYERAENTEFFAAGPFSGTPLRTLPARIKPLIHLDDGFYATDGQFIRDAAYRALHRGLSRRLPDYREEWNRRQKELTEGAFQRVFARQLVDARVLTDVYYRDPSTGAWAEADAVIELDDVLEHVEAKAGVGAMHSPATHFDSHVRAIQSLIVKAHDQSQRFFSYVASQPAVPLYQLREGQYVEVHRISLSSFRVVLPIGLTVESFSPFAGMSKEMPSISLVIGTHAFLSMSIDDLFLLNRLLPTSGELFHYLQVRQHVAGVQGARLFDESDHLGAYIEKNRFDLDLRSELVNADHVAWDGYSAVVDEYFAKDRWLTAPPPRQSFPAEVERLLDLLDKSRTAGWLAVDAAIRDFDENNRKVFARRLGGLLASLGETTHSWFVASVGTAQTVMVSLSRADQPVAEPDLIRVAEAAALATERQVIYVLCASATLDGQLTAARAIKVPAPDSTRSDYPILVREAATLTANVTRPSESRPSRDSAGVKLGRNDPCWCGSGSKYKRCHGR